MTDAKLAAVREIDAEGPEWLRPGRFSKLPKCHVIHSTRDSGEPILAGLFCYSFFSILAQVSLRVTVRLKTKWPGRECLESTQK